MPIRPYLNYSWYFWFIVLTSEFVCASLCFGRKNCLLICMVLSDLYAKLKFVLTPVDMVLCYGSYFCDYYILSLNCCLRRDRNLFGGADFSGEV